MTYHGHVENGVIVLDNAASLPEGVNVTVSVDGAQTPLAPAVQLPTLFERLASVVGRAEHVPADFGREHDRHIAGGPRP